MCVCLCTVEVIDVQLKEEDLYYGVFFFCSKVLFFGIRWFYLHLAFSISVMKPEHSNGSCLFSVKIKAELVRLLYSPI